MAVLLPLAGLASGSKTTPIDVSANVNGACVLGSTTPPLIEYDPVVTNATTDVQMLLGTLSVKCTSSRPVTFNADHGLYGAASGSYFQARMFQHDFSAFLNYSIYKDSGYTQVFGTTSTANGTTGGSTVSVSAVAGVTSNVPVYIDIPAGQNQTPGSYQDQIDFTVTY